MLVIVEEPTYTEWRMRYTKIAFLTFGLGLVLGLVVIAAEIKSLERVASGSMALGIAAIPIGIIADVWRAAKVSPTSPIRALLRI